jgi:Holliday junction resolvase
MKSSDIHASEQDLVADVVGFLNGQGYRVRCEVPNMGQSVDIVATKGRWVTFVEAKLAHWRRAFSQCEAHETVADYICVAVASVSVAVEFFEEACDRGYGIIHCERGRDCRWVVRPRRNEKVWLPQRRHWGKYLKVIAYADN